MNRNISGIGILLAALVFTGCPDPVMQSVDSPITLLAIPGVTAPVTGAIAVTRAIDTAQYTGTINWFPREYPFGASKIYAADIVLAPKAGWTLTGVAADSFTVTGATVTNAANSGTVTAVFPATLSFSLTMVGVPAGRFQRDGTVTNISVITQPYQMSAHEITRTQFLTIMGTDPSDTSRSSGTTDPVQRANWYHAIAFCNKLSLAEGLIPVYAVTVGGTPVNWSTLTYGSIPTTSNADWNAAIATWTNTGYRLPTEMEWMWAAMGAPADGQGGGTNTTGYLKGYAGSAEGADQINIGNYAWYAVNSGSELHPVGTKIANELGVYDMSGNVWEWCWDWSANYPAGTVTSDSAEGQGAASGISRVLHGGALYSNATSCTVASRGSHSPVNQFYYIGFRVVRSR